MTTTAVLITDMAGSTAFTDIHGDERAVELIRSHEAIVRHVLAGHEGREIKSMGDGFMIAFPSPSSAVACALDLQSALDDHNTSHPLDAIHVRMGLNLGPVIEEGGDLYGTTVNAAARIAAKARTGQLLVSEDAMRATEGGPWFYVDRGLFWLKGLKERWRLYEATRDPDVTPGPMLSATHSIFVNRDAERATLRRYVDACADGHGAVVLLGGEHGAGKSRLAEEVGLEAHGRGMRFYVGRCYEMSRGHTYTPLIDILEAIERDLTPGEFRLAMGETAGEVARLVPAIRTRHVNLPPAAELPPEQARRYLFTSLSDLLMRIAARTPLVLLLDDLHWSDEATLAFLEHLAVDLERLPVLVIGTYVNAELSSTRPLRATIEALHRRGVVAVLDIGALSPDDVGSLLRVLAGGAEPPPNVVDALYRQTEGNPFFLEEIVRHLDEQHHLFDEEGAWRTDLPLEGFDVPQTIRLTVGRRLDRLSSTARSVLLLAAVIGRGFGFELLETLHDGSEDELFDALDEAERAHLVTSTFDGGTVRFTFAHELVRQTLLQDVSLPRRQRLHLRTADAIERVFGHEPLEHAAELVYHLQGAGRWVPAGRRRDALLLAGERALETAAFEEAHRHFDDALSLTDDQVLRAHALERLGVAQRSLGQLDEAMGTWRDAIGAYQGAGRPQDVARICLQAGIQVAWWLGRGDVVGLVERGLEAAGSERTDERAGLLALQGAMTSQLGDYEHAEELLGAALDIAEEREDPRILGIALYARTLHHFAYAEYPKAAAFGSRGIEHLRRSPDLWNLANILGYVSASLHWLGRNDEAVSIGREGSELALKVGNWSAYMFCDRAISMRTFALDPDLEFYLEDGRRAVRLGEEHGLRWMLAVGHARLNVAEFWRGRWEDALHHAEQAARLDPGGATAGHEARLFLTHAYLGNRDEASRLIERARASFPRPGRPNPQRSWTFAMMAIEALATLGEREAAAELYPHALGVIETGSLARGWDYRLLQICAGIAATAAREWDPAEEHFEIALRQARDVPVPLEEPEACRFYAAMLLDRDTTGDRRRAVSLLDEALGIYRRLGMPAHVRLASELLARAQSA